MGPNNNIQFNSKIEIDLTYYSLKRMVNRTKYASEKTHLWLGGINCCLFKHEVICPGLANSPHDPI